MNLDPLPGLSEPPRPNALVVYWQQSQRPLASLLFTLPLLAMYEGGVLLLGPAALRNGADVWLRRLLDALGLGNYFVLPLLTMGVLLVWHHLTRQPWRVRPTVLYGMLVESAALAVALIAIAHVQGRMMARIGLAQIDAAHATLMLPWLAAAHGAQPSGFLGLLGRLIGFFGAGFYEEVLFRLLLLPAVAGIVAALGGSITARHLWAIAITSLAFSAAHYLGSQGDAFGWYTFVFRFLAGAFFAVLFVYRGFGIAAGTHALYDIFVGLF